MKVVTAEEMAAIDAATVERFGTPLRALMENAGAAVAAFVRSQFASAKNIVVLCGTGNNGGDGLVAARLLAAAGLHISVYVLGSEEKLKGDALDAYRGLVAATVPLKFLAEGEALVQLLADADLVVDAVVGTGFKPPLRGLAAAAREALRELIVPVVAVDLPSGWDADAVLETVPDAFRADAVVTFTAPKLAHLFGHLTAGVFGPVVVAPIGSPNEAVTSSTKLYWTGSSKRLLQTPRPIDSNKGMYGHVMVVGGAAGKAGAPSMASLACLRAGAGLVTAAIPSSILNTVALVTPELMTVPLEEDAKGALALRNADPEKLEKLTKRISVLAIGPGLGTEGEASAFVRALVANTSMPLVLDADGLNAFKGRTGLLKDASRGGERTIVLTPHPGEMGTLLGISTKEVQADRLNLARRFATEHCVTLVLKGWRTLVAHPDGSVAVNTTGNPSMAKGGSGDILTGIVAACLAQKPKDVADAVNAAVYLHGLAGDFVVQRMDEHTVLATDTVAHLSDAFRYRTADENGAEWVCGLRQ